MRDLSPKWSIPPENIKKYEAMFDTMEHPDDKVSGQIVSKMLRDTKLPVETLRIIWDLSDLDKDGCLDRYEFILTMHLICRCLEGESLPMVLPVNLIPPNKRGVLSQPLALMPPPQSASGDFQSLVAFSPVELAPSLISPPAPAWSSHNALVPTSTAVPNNTEGGPPPPLPDWAITATEKLQYSKLFAKMDQDMDGLVTGAEIRDFFLHSGLPQLILAKIWDLVDLHGTGTLNQEQFIVALHYANEQLTSGCTGVLPTTLPPAYIPPSLRPVTLDSSAYEESNRLIAEIEKLRKERFQVEQESTKMLSEGQMRTAEMSKLQTAEETLRQTSQSLTAQRAVASRYVAESMERKTRLHANLQEITCKVQEEQAKVEVLRTQVAGQQDSIRNQEDEVSIIRNQIAELKQEDSTLFQQVADRRTRLQAVDTENMSMSTRNEQETSKLKMMESTRGELLQALDLYAKLLAGDSSVTEPSDEQIKRLTVNDFGFSSLNEGPRIEGNSSVPLFLMNANESSLPGSNRNDKDAKFSLDPFTSTEGTDLFVAPFGSGADAFKTSDPFDHDPFAPSTYSSGAHVASNFDDPFCISAVGKEISFDTFGGAAKPSFDSSKFDAVFGSGLADNDPFSSYSGNKKVPPPRPTAMAVTKNKNSTNDLFAHTSGSGGRGSSKGGFANFTEAFASNSSKTDGGHRTTGGGAQHDSSPGKTSRFRPVLSKSNSRKHTDDQRRHSTRNNMPTNNTTSLSEAEQLQWAKLESQRAAQLEESLRKQEEVELELALRLSRMESLSSHGT